MFFFFGPLPPPPTPFLQESGFHRTRTRTTTGVGDWRRPGPPRKVQVWGGGQVGRDLHAGETTGLRIRPPPLGGPGVDVYLHA